MNRSPFSRVAPLTLILCSSLSSCAPKTPPGLILSFSSFEGSKPKAAEMGILRPAGKDEPWVMETIVETSKPEKVAVGKTADGRVLLARLDADGQPTGPPSHYYFLGDHWELKPVEGVANEDVEWGQSKGKTDTKDYELAGGNVFHKAMWFEPAFGKPGILTISANMPMIKIWRQQGDRWSSQILWSEDVGNKEHRFRDIEVGDVDGDGQDELVLATHDRGKVFVLEQKADGLEATEVAGRDEPTFVHEIELGDVDGDGMDEIFTTPSEPNRLDGSHQSGQIERIDFEGGQWVVRTVEESTTTHAKEILIADIEQDGQFELYSAMEGEGLGSEEGNASGDKATTQIKRYDFTGDSSTGKVLVDLPSKMCRFLTVGDLEGDGRLEVMASTDEDGIFRVSLEDGKWVGRSEVSALQSGGFEHSSVLFDYDGNGTDELFVADDRNKRVVMWWWDKDRGRLRKQELLDRSNTNYLTWGVMPLPAGN